MKTVKIRNIVLGEGRPKVCVPMTGKSREDILTEARAIKSMSAEGCVDLVEWRADCFEDVINVSTVHEILHHLRLELEELPILFTFRTVKEGGQRDISSLDYERLNRSIANSKAADMIDVEIFSGDEVVSSIIFEAHEKGVKVIGSNHDFQGTPQKDEIVKRLRQMQEMGVDVAKIAVMPNSKKDVLALMEAALEMQENYGEIPIVTISMGDIGGISRLAGEFFGSVVTFGIIEKASAPGQMEAKTLKSVLDVIHDCCYNN